MGPEPQPRITLIGATTDVGRLPATIVSRFDLRPTLTPYSDGEALEIAAVTAARLFPQPMAFPSLDNLRAVARAASNNPRTMGSILANLRDLALIDEGVWDGEHYDLSGQYFKEHRALRTETVVGDTRDFGIGRRVIADNWNALRAVGEHATQRLCDAQAADAKPAPDVATFRQVTQPSTDAHGLHAPALRFGDPRVMALLAALVGFTHLLVGFSNRQLVSRVATLLDRAYSSRQATYDLRRLRRKGLIQRLPGSFRYQLTPTGRRVAVLFTKAYGRVLAPGLAACDLDLPAEIAKRNPLAVAWRRLDKELDTFIDAALPAAA